MEWPGGAALSNISHREGHFSTCNEKVPIMTQEEHVIPEASLESSTWLSFRQSEKTRRDKEEGLLSAKHCFVCFTCTLQAEPSEVITVPILQVKKLRLKGGGVT